jgi:hypothetical protein
MSQKNQQLYDTSFNLMKSDTETNIDLTCPIIPLPVYGSIGFNSSALKPPLFINFSNNICTTDHSRANDSYQRHAWYMAGLWWVFYTNDCYLEPPNLQGLWYRTSSDRINWSAPATPVVTGAKPDETFNAGIWYSGTYLYYVAGDGTDVSSPSPNMRWRRGTPNTDGTITWSAAEQSIAPPSGGNAIGSVLWCFTDVGGNEWIISGRANFANNYVQRNANHDGTWSTNLSHSQASTRLGAVPLPNGNVTMFWTSATTPYYHSFSTYNGSTWSPTVTASTYQDYDGISFSAVATIDNQVHMTYVNGSNKMVYLIYDSISNTILSEAIVPGATPNTNVTIATDSNKENTNCFWGDIGAGTYNVIAYLKRTRAGVFSSIARQAYPYSDVFGRGVESWDDSGGYMFFIFGNTDSGGTGSIILSFWTP